MKDYYEILQVRRQASQAEIKRAFRRLALQYHPDKNPDVRAEQVFKEINEAYEVLSDPFQRQSYDSGTVVAVENTVTPPSRPAHRDPAYRRTAHPPSYKSEKQRMIEFMMYYLPHTKRIVQASFIISVFLVMDFVLPAQVADQVIRDISVVHSRSKGNDATMYITTDEGRVVQLSFDYARYFSKGDRVELRNSLILKIPLTIRNHDVTIRISKTIYGLFAWAPLALLGSSVYGIFYPKKIEYEFNTGVVCGILVFLLIAIYLIL
jgi:hypothetical protein